jgi:hypothetical protein
LFFATQYRQLTGTFRYASLVDFPDTAEFVLPENIDEATKLCEDAYEAWLRRNKASGSSYQSEHSGRGFARRSGRTRGTTSTSFKRRFFGRAKTNESAASKKTTATKSSARATTKRGSGRGRGRGRGKKK